MRVDHGNHRKHTARTTWPWLYECIFVRGFGYRNAVEFINIRDGALTAVAMICKDSDTWNVILLILQLLQTDETNSSDAIYVVA